MRDKKLTDTTWEDVRKVVVRTLIGMIILAAILTAVTYLL